MAKCVNCVPEPVRLYSDKQPVALPCKECGETPAYWWQPSNGSLTIK